MWFARLALVLVAALLAGCPDEPAVSTTPYPWDEDGTVLNQLAQAGSNMEQAHVIQFLLYFPTEAQASAAAKSVGELSAGILPEVHPAKDGDDWLCLGILPMVPEHAELAALRVEFKTIATANSGKYDGWQTSLVE
jgi:hypothetical protein